MLYFIPQTAIDLSNDRWQHKGGRGTAPKHRKGYIALFDRNTGRYDAYRIIRQCQNRYGYIAERNKPIAAYWQQIIQPD